MRAGVILCVLFLLAVAAFSFSKRSYFNEKHPVLDQIRERFAMIDPKYAKIPLQSGDSAYTENKEVITLCLVDPTTGKYYDMNTLMYVALHELAHVISKNEGHGEEFKKNFAMLLREAATKGIYDPNKPIPSTYCKVSTGA
jgi:hypothetical protein